MAASTSSKRSEERSVNDNCRMCCDNLRIKGKLVSSHRIFEGVPYGKRIDQRLAEVGLNLVNIPERSYRICMKCLRLVDRHETTLATIRGWQKAEEEPCASSTSAATTSTSAASSTLAAIVRKRDRVRTPSKLPAQPPTPTGPPSSKLPRSGSEGIVRPRQSVTEVVIHYPSKAKGERLVCQDHTAGIVEAMAKQNWSWAAKQIARHKLLQGPLTENILRIIEEECKKLCSPLSDVILSKSSAEDLKEFSFEKLQADFQRVSPFLFSIFLCITKQSPNPACAAAAIALRGREPRLSAFSQYVNCVLQYGGVKKAAFKRLSKLCITTSYSTALRKQMELAKTCGEDFQLLKVANEIFLNEADTRTAATRSSTPDVAERHLDEASYLCMSAESFEKMDLGLPLSSACNVTERQFGLRVTVKEEEDIQEEEYGHMSACQDEDEKPLAELDCKTETDVTESNHSETQQTTAEIEVKIEEDEEPNVSYNETQQAIAEIEVKIEEDDEQEHDYLLQSVSDHPHITEKKIHGQNDQLNLQLEGALYPCIICKKSFTDLTEFEKHQQAHSVGISQKQNTGVSEHPPIMEKKIHGQNDQLNLQLEGALYPCIICKKSFTDLTEFEKHQQAHSVGISQKQNTGKKLHTCAQCGKVFSQISHLNTHMLMHTGEKPHKCIDCGKRFSQSSNLKSHMLIHRGDKPHACTQCGKAFTHLNSLKIHTLTHTGEKPHECANCGKAFGRLGQLQRHMIIHTGEKPYECVQCGKAFPRSASLKHHMQTHTGEKPHKCNWCGKGFSHLLSLKNHMSSHTGEKRHTCSQCGKGFYMKSHLKTHMLIHTGEKPHICGQCGKAFAQSSNLKSHMLLHSE